MRVKFFLSSALIFSLLSCQENNVNFTIKTICPTGAPALCFFDQGNNENFVTNSNASQVLGQFQTNDYQFIVVDSVSGLDAIKKYNANYRFVKLLTSGNLYLVSFVKNSDPMNGDSVLAFGGSTTIPHLSYEAFCKKINKNDFASTTEYADGVANVLAKAKSNLNYKDYYLFAEPALTTLLSSADGIQLKYKKKLSSDDALGAIPQAALFVNYSSYIKYKSNYKEYIKNLDSRIDDIFNNFNKVKTILDGYGDDSSVNKRFGFKSGIAELVQNSDNGFAICKSDYKYTCAQLNKFLETINLSYNFSEDLFLDVYA